MCVMNTKCTWKKDEVMNKVKKIINHIKEEGIIDTVRWLYNCVLFRIKRRKIKSNDFVEIENDNDEVKYRIKKVKPNVFIVASIPYYDIGGGQRCSQLAKTFNKMGYNVNYLYAFKSSESTIFNLEMPMSSHIFIDDNIISKIESKVFENDLFIFESPSIKFEKILDFAIQKKCKIVYENIDNWETSLGSGIYNEQMLIKLLKSADLLVGTAKPLVDQLYDYIKKFNIPEKKVIYLANAVDSELFCGLKELEKPYDLVTDKCTLLYYGSLWGEWFDWDLVIDLAINNPRYSINIIGDYSGIPNIVKKCPYNIHFLGLKKQIELPSYLKYVDYSFIPFKTGEIGDYVSPLKIFEYISMYTNVLSTTLPDISGYPNLYFGDTWEEWDSIIKNNNTVDIEKADDFADNNSWHSRITEIINEIYPEKNKSILKDNLSIVILNYNNKNIIFKSINSLLKYNELYNYEIIVVDNGSTDGSYELLEKKYKNKIKLVKNTKNGCSSGRNLGAQLSTKKYLMFLDSDQWITNKYWLEPYENILEEDTKIGLIGWAAGFFNNNGYAYHVVDSFPYKYMPANMLAREDIGYLGSGGMLLEKKLFDEIDGFDINYDPTCYEDTDLSLKVRNENKKIVYCPYLGIVHLPHQTTKSGSEGHKILLKEKREYFKNKWTDKNKKLLKLFIK